MDEIIKNYHNLFPQVPGADWMCALFGLVLHAVLKFKDVMGDRKEFIKRLEHFFIVWTVCFIAILISFEMVPEATKHFDWLEAAVLSYSYSSLFYNLFKKIYQ